MLVKPCAKCKRYIQYNGRSYCSTCSEIVEKEREERSLHNKRIRDRAYNKKRDPKYAKFYNSSDWRRLRNAKMDSANYRCEDCFSIATEVHHIKPIQTPEGWELRLEWNNLRAVCAKCHNKAHGRWGKNTNRNK